MGHEKNEHYLKRELYEFIKKDLALYDFIQESSLDGMWYWNLEKIEDEWFSPKFWEVLGYDPKGKKHNSSEWQNIIFKDDLKQITDNFNKHLQDPKHPYDQIVRYKHKNGSIVWIRCRGVAIRDASGKAIRMVGAHVNISNEQTQIKDLKNLTKMTEALLMGIEKELDYQKITDNILEISDAKFVALNLYDVDGKHYTTKNMSGNKVKMNKAMNIMGIKLDNKQWAHDSVRAHKIKDKVVTRFPTLYDLAGDVIPKSICALLVKSFSLGETVLIKISKDNVMLGDFTLIMPKGKTFNKDSIVEIYANQLGLALTNVQANEKIKESEQRFRVTVQSLDDGVIIHAPDSSIIDANDRALEILGLTRNQLLGKKAIDPIWEFVDEDKLPLPLKKYPVNWVIEKQKPINNLIIGIIQSANKDITWTKVKGSPIFDPKGNLKEVVISFFDITELINSNKRLQESEQRFKILHNASFGGVAVHEKGIILECNQGLSDVTGYSMDELVGMNGLLLMAPDYRDFVMDKIVTGYEKPYEAFGIRKNGEIYPIRLEARNLPYQEKQVRVVEFRDITELKHKNNQLIESEKRFRTLFEKAPFGYQSLDVKGHFIDVNDKWLEIMGYQKEEVIGKWFGDFLTPDMKAHFKKRYEMFKERGHVHSEFSMKTKAGGTILVGFDGNISYNENHEFIQTHCTVSDITEITIINKKLKERTTLIEGLFNHMSAGVAIYEVMNEGLHGKDYIIKDFNDTSLRWENKSRNEVVGKAISELHPNIDDSGIIEFFRKVWKTGEALTFPAKQYVNGDYNRWHENRIFKLPSGEIVAMYDDITDRVEKEHEISIANQLLKQSEEQYRLLTTQMPLGLNLREIVYDKEGKPVDYRFLTVNESYELMTGLKQEELIGKTAKEVLPEIEKHWIEKYKEVVLTGESIQFEDYSRALGKYFKVIAYPLPKGIFAVIVDDITDRVEKEHEISIANQLLKQSEEQYRLLTTQMQLGLALHEIICDDNGKPIDYKFISVNDSFEKLTGLKKEDILGKTVLEVMPNIEKHWIDTYGKVALSGKSIQYENYSQDLGKYYNTSAYSPKKGHFAVIIDDITDRVLMEKQRTKERKDLLVSQGMAKLGTWRLDVLTNEVIWSEELYKMYGFDSTLPPPPYTEHMKLFTRSSWEKLSSALALTASEGIPYELILETITQEGSNGWMWVRGEAEYDAQGKISSISGAAQDITQKKQKEDEILYVSNHDFLTEVPNRRYYQEMLKKYDNEVFYPLGIIIMDMNGLKLINDAFGHSVGNEALIICANTLNEAKRDNDFLARIGGDEFAMICPNIDVELMEKQIDFIDKTVAGKSIKEIDLSLAIGYEIKQYKHESIRTILTNAENYMYRNKVLTKHTSQNDKIQSILNTLTEKYHEEKIHSSRVSQYCKAMGEVLQLRKDEIIELELAGMVHDIGKISLPDAILKKPGKLTKKEWEVIRNHTLNGYQILRAADKYSSIAEYAMSHHERIDGKGYPNGISGEDIPLFSRIISVADAYEAMTSDRPYRKAMKKEEAIKELEAHAGTQFDTEIVEVFIHKVLQL